MTKREIRQIVIGLIKDEWVEFKNPTDKKSALDLARDKDMELGEVLSFLEAYEISEGEKYLEDMRSEYEAM